MAFFTASGSYHFCGPLMISLAHLGDVIPVLAQRNLWSERGIRGVNVRLVSCFVPRIMYAHTGLLTTASSTTPTRTPGPIETRTHTHAHTHTHRHTHTHTHTRTLGYMISPTMLTKSSTMRVVRHFSDGGLARTCHGVYVCMYVCMYVCEGPLGFATSSVG
jgi:hypothetical protein